MANNATPLDLNSPPLNFELDGNSDSIGATLQLSRSHDENHVAPVIYPDCSGNTHSSSLHAQLTGIGNAVTDPNELAGICSDSAVLNIQLEENMAVRSNYCNDLAGPTVTPDRNCVRQSLGIPGNAIDLINCSSVNSIPFELWSHFPTDITNQSWKNLDSCDNFGNSTLGNSHLNSIQYDNGQQIGSGHNDFIGPAANVPMTADQIRNGYFVDYLNRMNGFPSTQVNGNLLDLTTAPRLGLSSNEGMQIMENCNSQRLSAVPNAPLSQNSMWRDAGFLFGGSNLIDNYNVSAGTEHSSIIYGGIHGQIGNDRRVGDGWPTTIYAADGIDAPQAVFQRNVDLGKNGGWTGVEEITGLQHNHNVSMLGNSNGQSMFNMRQGGENFQKPETNTCYPASNAETSSITANDKKEGVPHFDQTLLHHQPFVLDRQIGNDANNLTRHLVSNSCSVRRNSLDGSFLSGYQAPLSNCDNHGISMCQGIGNPVVLSKGHKQSPSSFLHQPSMNLKALDYASGKGHTSSNTQGLENNLKMNLPRPPVLASAQSMAPVYLSQVPASAQPTPPIYLPLVPAPAQPTTATVPPSTVGRQPSPKSIRSHTAGALNNAPTIHPFNAVAGQGIIGRRPVPMGINNTIGIQPVPMGNKSLTAGVLNDPATYYSLSAGFPQVPKGSKIPKVAQMSFKDQIKALPMQQTPHVPPISTPGYNSGGVKTCAKRICLGTTTATMPVCAPKTAVPVPMPGRIIKIGKDVPVPVPPVGKTGPNYKPLPKEHEKKSSPAEHDKKLAHITCRDLTDPVKMPLGTRCELCSIDLMFLPKGSSGAYKDDPPMSAVMACGHSFHISCLEEVGCSTERSKDPPCPLCAFPE